MSRLLQCVMGVHILLGCAHGLAGELVKNGNFHVGTDGWTFSKQKDYTAEATPVVRKVNGAPAYTLLVSELGRGGALNLFQPVDIVEGKFYQLTIDLKGKGEGKIGFKINRTKKPWSHCGVQRALKPGLDWRRYVLSFQAKEVPTDHKPTVRLHFGTFKGHIALGNISLREIPPKTIKGDTGDMKELAIAIAPAPVPKPKPRVAAAPPQAPRRVGQEAGAATVTTAQL